MLRLISISTAAAWLVAAGPAAAPASPEEHVRGVVGAVTGDTLTVKAADGRTVTLKLDDRTRVATAVKADVDAIASGAFVGTNAVEARDGTLRALEVHVFPESMRGTGEGQHPWDRRPGDTMTNATVSGAEASGARPPSTMTNAKVSDATGATGGKRLTLSYPGGQKTVLVAPGTPVVRLVPADRAAIAAGRHVFAAGPRQPDGTVKVGRIFVGEDGVVPPM